MDNRTGYIDDKWNNNRIGSLYKSVNTAIAIALITKNTT
jgi:hypothetical protein